MHVLVPGGGPSLDGTHWITSRHPTDPHYKKRYLADVETLGQTFRDKFAAGLKRLHGQGKIQYTPPPLPDEDDPRRIGYQETFDEWTDRIGGPYWNVYIEPPPKHSTPAHALKYLARYMSGGPISDGRLISHEDGKVKFWARGKDKKPRPFPLTGREFVRRWALHILPKGYIRSRAYGGFSYSKRGKYLALCRKLLPAAATEAEPPPDAATEPEAPPDAEGEADKDEPQVKECPRCQAAMIDIRLGPRASWKDIFANHAKCPIWYAPFAPYPRIRGPDGR